MENKKTKIISIGAVVALALTVITATYAYFNAQVGDPAVADIKVNANTVDTFTFSNGSAISFSINQDNFASGKGNQTGSTYASATLTANNKTNTATEHYYLYLNIENNTFTYSINESTPEIIMTITDSSGTEVTDISTLNHVIVTGANGAQVSGYDITNKNGLITLFNNREITTTSSKEERWNVTITFVNYDASQNGNAGKSMSAKMMIQKEVIPQLVSDVCTNGENLATCITTLSNKSIPSATNIYHHDSNLSNGAGDNSYRYSGQGDDYYTCIYDGNAVKHYAKNGNDEENKYNQSLKGDCSHIYRVPYIDKNGNIYDEYYDKSLEVIFEKTSFVATWDNEANECVATNESGEWIIINGLTGNLTSESCTGTIYKKNYIDDYYVIGIEEMGAGKETIYSRGVRNFICFGSTASLCPTDNLYRIIGVFGDKVKLIKYDYATKEALGTDGDYENMYTYDFSKAYYKGNNYDNVATYYWNKATSNNTWSEGLLNKTNLNTNFLNNIGTKWSNKIATATWKVSGNILDNIQSSTPSETYQNEIVNPTINTDKASEYNSKIGLIYVSDYKFAASPSTWVPYNNYSYMLNWMHMGLSEWTISPESSTSYGVFDVDDNGIIGAGPAYYGFAVRPSFYLEASVTYKSGSGTQLDPIMLS